MFKPGVPQTRGNVEEQPRNHCRPETQDGQKRVLAWDSNNIVFMVITKAAFALLRMLDYNTRSTILFYLWDSYGL